jgi:hypothetical protein
LYVMHLCKDTHVLVPGAVGPDLLLAGLHPGRAPSGRHMAGSPVTEDVSQHCPAAVTLVCAVCCPEQLGLG